MWRVHLHLFKIGRMEKGGQQTPELKESKANQQQVTQEASKKANNRGRNRVYIAGHNALHDNKLTTLPVRML
jgi:hypothetical protein